MSQPDALVVWYEHRRVGTLWRNPVGLMGFRYHPEWIETGFAISRSLPLADREFPPEAATAHRFFANLLPEGGVREQIVRDLKLPDSDFELLRAIGGNKGTQGIRGHNTSGNKGTQYLTASSKVSLAGIRGHNT